MRFWLGLHHPGWMSNADEPMISHRRLAVRRTLPTTLGPWVLDSGGFTELSMNGSWDAVTPGDYADAVRRYRDEIGQLEWAAPQDWMCEPFITTKTGLTVAEHQVRTVGNYLDLRSTAPDLPFIPVIQGFTLDEYHHCVDLYDKAGVNLTAAPVVGIGSVCRRQATTEAATIIRSVAERGLRLHGFGLKLQAVDRLSGILVSADSMAWSYAARRSPSLPGCSHRNCANCLRYALRWREKVLRRASTPTLFDKEVA